MWFYVQDNCYGRVQIDVLSRKRRHRLKESSI